MNGAHTTQTHQSRRQSILGNPSHGIGLARLLEVVSTRSAATARHCPAVFRGEQWAACRMHELFVKAGMDKQRYGYPGPTRTRGCRLPHPDADGGKTEQGCMVCGDVVVNRLDAGDGYCEDRFRARPISQERPGPPVEITTLKPSGGGCGGGIAPYSGVDGVPFIPLDGVMRTPIRTFPAPPAGDYLDIAICIGGNNHETACR
jgi:hypothetical protein